MTTIILIAIVAYAVYIFISKDTVNPVTVMKYGAKDMGIALGATPRVLRDAKKTATALALESKLELIESGEATKVSFKEGRREGQLWAREVLAERDKELETRIESAKAKLAILTEVK